MSHKYIIAVDDGHGINTAGKQTPDGYKENNFNHAVKNYLIRELHFNGFKTVDCSPTRNDNSLQNRCDIANNANADIFISIHYNAMGSKWQDSVGGIETFSYPTSTKGRILATHLQKELLKGTPLKDRGVKTAKFYVLKHTKMPATLVECGFMDNKREATLMKSTEYRQECASEIAKGVCNYFNVPYKTPRAEDDDYKAILKRVSKWYPVWIEFVNKNQKEINLIGLIEKLYKMNPK